MGSGYSGQFDGLEHHAGDNMATVSITVCTVICLGVVDVMSTLLFDNYKVELVP